MKKFGTAILIMSLLWSMTACGSVPSEAVEKESEVQEISETVVASSKTGEATEQTVSIPLRIDVVSTGTQAIPAYIMQKENLAEKYGIDLQVHDNSGAWGSEWTALKTGEVDCIITAWTYSAMNYDAAPTVCVAPMFGWGNSVITSTDSGVNSLEDFKDIKLGVYQTTALDWVLMCAAAEKQYGFSPADECEVSEAAAGLLGGMLQQGNIDAALSYADTNVILGAEDGYKVLFSMSDCLDDLGLNKETPFLFYTFSKTYYEEHPEIVAAFVDMYKEVYNILMSDDEIWNEIASDCFGVTNADAVPALRDTIRACILQENTEDTEKQCQDMLNWCQDNGYGDLIGISDIPEGMIINVK